jgi:hypothetical protein
MDLEARRAIVSINENLMHFLCPKGSEGWRF